MPESETEVVEHDPVRELDPDSHTHARTHAHTHPHAHTHAHTHTVDKFMSIVEPRLQNRSIYIYVLFAF